MLLQSLGLTLLSLYRRDFVHASEYNPSSMMEGVTDMSTAAGSATELSPIIKCPFCHVPVLGKEDKFCRKCGYRILQCAKCNQPVRECDRYCGACGAKRLYLLELWRQGALHRSPLFVSVVTLVVGASWLTLYYVLRKHR
uniref:DZANK-type domain-containing protein n=1 Tax=Ascaris lumbricoides TaxID=6252 RepID=A0A0M3IIS1_ASCLU